MALRHKSAVKRHRQSLVREARNRALRSRMRTAIRGLREVIASNDGAKASTLFPGIAKEISKAATKGVIHRNTASRYISRLGKQVASLQKAS